LRLDEQKLGQSRDEVFRSLRAQGIGVHVHYRPIHLHSYYAQKGWKPGDCPQAETAFSALLTLPMHPSLTDAMVEREQSGKSGFRLGAIAGFPALLSVVRMQMDR